jgi:tetratricopeptide (TPR) repeat protein
LIAFVTNCAPGRRSLYFDNRAFRPFVVPYHGWAFHALGRACLLLDRLEQAKIRARRALEYSARQPGFAAHALHLLGDIASHPGRVDPPTGEVHYRQALALAEPRGMTPLVAHCHLGLGKLYRQVGKRKQAQAHVTKATAIYRDTGMTFWQERAEVEKRQLQ